ncbi:MAG: hypothetical protein KKD05_08325, partial [Candidatus Omnitrophica bacterium]|nr:hypothetical protein [Candidatus Omnitrophota bacterium]
MLKKIICILLIQTFLTVNLGWAQGAGAFDTSQSQIDTLAPEVMLNTGYFQDAFSGMMGKQTVGAGVENPERRAFLNIARPRQQPGQEEFSAIDGLLSVFEWVISVFKGTIKRRSVLGGIVGGLILTTMSWVFNTGTRFGNRVFAADSLGVVENLVSHTGNFYDLEIASVGAYAYTDRIYTIESLPEKLEGTILVKTPNDDKFETGENVAEFTVTDNSIVYAAYQPGAAELTPEFLANYKKTDMTMQVKGLNGDILT